MVWRLLVPCKTYDPNDDDHDEDQYLDCSKSVAHSNSGSSPYDMNGANERRGGDRDGYHRTDRCGVPDCFQEVITKRKRIRGRVANEQEGYAEEAGCEDALSSRTSITG